jgi:hypothetical protein
VDSIVTITTPAASTALTTVAAVEDELGAAMPADVRVTNRLIAQASAAVAAHVRTVLVRETVAETFRDVAAWPDLPLSRRPVVSVTSIVVDGITLAADGWELGGEASCLYRLFADRRTTWSGAKIVVTYAGGYIPPGTAGATLPADIERAVLITIAAAVQSRGQDPRLRSESVDGVGGQSWLDPSAAHGALPWQAAELLAPHRRYP